MVEDTGEIRVNNEATIMQAHFFDLVQFLGFPRSSGPSHITYATNQFLHPQRKECDIERTNLGSAWDGSGFSTGGGWLFSKSSSRSSPVSRIDPFCFIFSLFNNSLGTCELPL
jgi:hypothetical protein